MNPNIISNAYMSEKAGLQIKFSPFQPNILALSCAQNFGIAGAGQLKILQTNPSQRLQLIKEFNESDAIFDCSFSEKNENYIATAGGKGTISLWNINSGMLESKIQAHMSEVQSIEFSHKQLDLMISSGSDGFVKLWNIATKAELLRFQAHQGISYQTTWHPHNQDVFASVGQDGFMKLWDLKSQQQNVLSFRCHDQEILSCDFNKYTDQIVTGSIDKSIKIWDLRNIQKPVNALFGHRYPVRKVKCSPHEGNIVASGSYDMNVNIWDINNINKSLVIEHKKHTEFIIGLDFNIHQQRQIASTGYDGRALVWNWDLPQPEIF